MPSINTTVSTPYRSHHVSAFSAAAGRYEHENTSNVPPRVAAYVCRPCVPAGSSEIWGTNYNSSFPPIQSSSGGSQGSGLGSGTHGRRPNNNNRHDVRPLVAAADDGGERSLPRQPSNGLDATPQNLRDNPQRLAKVKTEMCIYRDDKGSFDNCPYGDRCEYSSFRLCALMWQGN